MVGGGRENYLLTWYLNTGVVGGEEELFTYVVSDYWGGGGERRNYLLTWYLITGVVGGRGGTIYLRGI